MSFDHESLALALTRLKLTGIRDQLDSLLDEAAKRELTLREALAFLVEREVARKDERRIEMAGSGSKSARMLTISRRRHEPAEPTQGRLRRTRARGAACWARHQTRASASRDTRATGSTFNIGFAIGDIPKAAVSLVSAR